MGAKVRPENFKGNKNSGRRPLSEEIIERARKKHFEELSKELVSRQLESMLDDKNIATEEVEKFALPIVLKGMTTRQDLTTGGKPLVIPPELLTKNNIATNEPNTQPKPDCNINE